MLLRALGEESSPIPRLAGGGTGGRVTQGTEPQRAEPSRLPCPHSPRRVIPSSWKGTQSSFPFAEENQQKTSLLVVGRVEEHLPWGTLRGGSRRVYAEGKGEGTPSHWW